MHYLSSTTNLHAGLIAGVATRSTKRGPLYARVVQNDRATDTDDSGPAETDRSFAGTFDDVGDFEQPGNKDAAFYPAHVGRIYQYFKLHLSRLAYTFRFSVRVRLSSGQLAFQLPLP